MTARASGGSRTAAKRAAGAGRAATFEPLSFSKRAAPDEQDRIPLFEIDGTEYTIPAAIPTGTALVLLANTAGLTEARRGMALIEALAGNAALNALLQQADMSQGDWHKLIASEVLLLAELAGGS